MTAYGLDVAGVNDIEVSLPPAFPDLGDWGGKKPEETDANIGYLALAEQLAWATMLRLTAYQVTPAPITIRPVCNRCAGRTWLTDAADFDAVILTHHGAPVVWSETLESCGLGHHIIRLERPVGRIVEVRIGGQVLSPAAYRIDNQNELTRVDGGMWPTQQDLTAPFGSASSFEVTYYRGHRPDALFVWAVGQLAYEFYAASAPAVGGKKLACRLPSGVTNVVRQGVSYEINNVPFSNGRTGITEIDSVLMRYNPNGLTARPTVLSTDILRRKSRTIGMPPVAQPSPTPPPLGFDALARGVLLRISRGSDFSGAFVYRAGDPGNEQPVDLTGWSAQAQIRDMVGGTVWISMTSGQEITLGADGTVTMQFSHTYTEPAVWDTRKTGVWDLELTSPTGRRIRFAEGTVRVSQDVTR